MAVNNFTSKILLHAVDVGAPITNTMALAMKREFTRRFPGLRPNTSVSSSALRQTLAANAKVCGVQFVFGMEDSAKFDSLTLLLVPCSPIDGGQRSAQAIRIEEGYYDVDGNLRSLDEVVRLSANFANCQIAFNPELTLDTAHRASYFGRKALESVVATDGCEHVLLHFGFKTKFIQVILDSANSTQQSLNVVMWDFGSPIPPGQPGTWWWPW